MGWNSLGKDAVLILVLMDNQNTWCCECVKRVYSRLNPCSNG